MDADESCRAPESWLGALAEGFNAEVERVASREAACAGAARAKEVVMEASGANLTDARVRCGGSIVTGAS